MIRRTAEDTTTSRRCSWSGVQTDTLTSTYSSTRLLSSKSRLRRPETTVCSWCSQASRMSSGRLSMPSQTRRCFSSQTTCSWCRRSTEHYPSRSPTSCWVRVSASQTNVSIRFARYRQPVSWVWSKTSSTWRNSKLARSRWTNSRSLWVRSSETSRAYFSSSACKKDLRSESTQTATCSSLRSDLTLVASSKFWWTWYRTRSSSRKSEVRIRFDIKLTLHYRHLNHGQQQDRLRRAAVRACPAARVQSIWHWTRHRRQRRSESV